jgi:hypothetical protein
VMVCRAHTQLRTTPNPQFTGPAVFRRRRQENEDTLRAWSSRQPTAPGARCCPATPVKWMGLLTFVWQYHREGNRKALKVRWLHDASSARVPASAKTSATHS